jgi:hypothetical protein
MFVNAALTKLSRWVKANHMAVVAGKTKFILFNTRGTKFETQNCRIFYHDNKPNMNNPVINHEIKRYHNSHHLPEKRSYKLLGIHFDKRLSFDIHTMHLCNKLNRSLFFINRAKKFLIYNTFIH